MKNHLYITRDIQKRLEIHGQVVSAPVLHSFSWWQWSILVLQHDLSQINPNTALLGINACSLPQSPKPALPLELTAAKEDFFKPFQTRQRRSQLPISYQHHKTKNQVSMEVWGTLAQLMIIPSLPALEEVYTSIWGYTPISVVLVQCRAFC